MILKIRVFQGITSHQHQSNTKEYKEVLKTKSIRKESLSRTKKFYFVQYQELIYVLVFYTEEKSAKNKNIPLHSK